MEQEGSQQQEDPRRRNNLRWVYMQKFSSVWVPKQFEKELKMADDKNKTTIWALILSLLALITTFQQNYYNNQLVVTPKEIIGLYCHDQPLNDPPPFLSGFISGVFNAGCSFANNVLHQTFKNDLMKISNSVNFHFNFYFSTLTLGNLKRRA